MTTKRDQIIKDHLLKSEENFKFYQFLAKENKYNDWQVVALFYSALCFVKACIYKLDKVDLNKVNSHSAISKEINKHKIIYNTGIAKPYKFLYDDSRDARYNCKKISEARVKKALENYNKIKSLLKF